jgi:tetratricopeptide (TPR) repeat protein
MKQADSKDLDDLISQETECIQKLRNLAEYHMIYSRVNFVIRRGGFARNDSERKIVNELENYHLIKGKNTALSSRAASICYYIKGVCNAFNRNYDEALINFQKTRDIIDKNKHLKPDLAQRYVRTLSLILTCYIELQDYQKANQVIEEINKLNDEEGFSDTNTQLRIQTTVLISTLQISNKTGDQNKGFKLVAEIIKLLDKNAAKINKEQVIEFYVNIAGVYFINSDYKESLYWLNKVLNDNEKLLRRDLYNFARIFNLIIHYELGNHDLLEYVIKSTARHLNKDENDYVPEALVIKNLRKLIKFNNEKARHDTYREMKNDFDKLFTNSNEKVLLDYFDMNAWVESKIKGQKFSEVLQHNSK